MNTNSPYFYRHNKPTWSSVFNSVEKQMESLFAGLPTFFDFDVGTSLGLSPVSSGVRWFESDAAYQARVDLPGVDAKDVQLTLEDQTLQIEAARAADTAGEGEARRNAQRYRVTIALPDGVDSESIGASCDKGVLSIHLPKAAKLQPRRIEVVATA